MTTSYNKEVATSNFSCFLRLLKRWKGSIYKLIWVEMLLFLLIYYALHFLYIFILNDSQKRAFEEVVEYCDYNETLIPLSFVLGFYLKVIVTRWWEQYQVIPWPDRLGVYVSTLLLGQDERGRLMRRTIMRYTCLCLAMVFSMISPTAKKRFPTMDHFIDAGLLLENEKNIINDMNDTFPKHRKHWMPIIWASGIITRARKEGRLRDDSSLQTLINELNDFRGMCTNLIHYDTGSVPLVYTQVVTLVVYSYFIGAAIAQQWTEGQKDDPNKIGISYFPFFTLLEFFFFMGCLKVAETLICPFGEDDDDFEVNKIIDRNLQVSYLIVDEMHQVHPELVNDQLWYHIYNDISNYSVEHSDEISRAGMGSSDAFIQYLSQVNFALEKLIEEEDKPSTYEYTVESQENIEENSLLLLEDLSQNDEYNVEDEWYDFQNETSELMSFESDESKDDYFELLKENRAKQSRLRHRRRLYRSAQISAANIWNRTTSLPAVSNDDDDTENEPNTSLDSQKNNTNKT